jgi:hypothetical protein
MHAYGATVKSDHIVTALNKSIESSGWEIKFMTRERLLYLKDKRKTFE